MAIKRLRIFAEINLPAHGKPKLCHHKDQDGQNAKLGESFHVSFYTEKIHPQQPTLRVGARLAAQHVLLA